jgi:hypothetical protein
MSLQTWKREFYSTIRPFRNRGPDWLAAIDHSIKKWEGATKANTKKHGVTYSGVAVRYEKAGSKFVFSGGNCALCVKVESTPGVNTPDDQCEICPVVIVTGESCVTAYGRSGGRSLYREGSSPAPMLRLLRTVRRRWVKRL